MSISVKTRKMLWGRAASRCAFLECRRELVVDAIEADEESLIGEECHIIAQANNGPRGNPDYDVEQRDEYENLILLCNIHHKIIDDQANTFTVGIIKRLKVQHEDWVRSSLKFFDPAKQRDDEQYADIMAEWAIRVDIDNWLSWSSSALSGGQPVLRRDTYTRLKEAVSWCVSRVWPGRYRELEAAFKNFAYALSDFLIVFDTHANHNEEQNNRIWTEKFYSRMGWNEHYEQDLRRYNEHVDLVQDLMLEVTRAANYICDWFRVYIDQKYRTEEGILLVEYGPISELRYVRVLPQYQNEERKLLPYPGLEQFKFERVRRDHHFGGT